MSYQRFPITKKQQQIIEMIETSEKCPSYQEMADHIGFVKSNIHRNIKTLIERGYLEKLPHRARALRVIPEHEKSVLAFLEQRGLTQDYQQWSNT